MSKDHLTAKEREERKVILILNGALNKVLNTLEEKDFPHVFTAVNTRLIADLLFEHRKFMEQFNVVYKDDDRKLTIFDKALCMAMAMERHSIIYTSSLNSKAPQRLHNLSQKTIVEAVLLYISHSTYHIKRTDVQGDFDISVFDNGHKKELKAIKDLLVEEFKNVNFDYNRCFELLQEIYYRGICYANGLDVDMAVTLRNKTTIKEKYTSPQHNVPVNKNYSEYRKKFRA